MSGPDESTTASGEADGAEPSRPDDASPAAARRDDERPAAARGDEASAGARRDEPEWVRRRRLAAVFGDVLPTTTRDERDPGSTEDGELGAEKWLRAQVPPHHGGH